MVQGNEILRDEVIRKLRLEYLHGQKDQTIKALDKIRPVLARFQEQNLKLMNFLQDIADTTNKLFWLKEVTIGLRDPDGKYRYKVMCGLRQDAWTAHKRLAYTREEFSDPKLYKCSQISKHTSVFLSEDKPFVDGELDTFTRPILLEEMRKTVDDCIEGDYFDTHILGENDEPIGWVEFSGTKDGRFPGSTGIRWIELLALIVGIAITRESRKSPNHQARGR